MKQVLIFHTGEETCSEKPSYPGSMCQFVRTQKYGKQYICGLFDYQQLPDVGGWLQRLPECRESFRGAAELSQIVHTEKSK